MKSRFSTVDIAVVIKELKRLVCFLTWCKTIYAAVMHEVV